MQTNPNIILSGNQMAQPRLPDVNAMMQTRTAGMENIYNIEQQRAAQAQAAQKEQEAAAVEAMLPSVVAAYSDPSDAGLDQAVALMPAEVRDTFAPFVSRLKTVRDPAARKAILEAELAKDEAGRAVLSRISTPYQAGMMGLQREQQDIARQRLAMEESQLGMPAPMSAADRERIDLEERRVRIAEEAAAREAAKADAIAAGERGPTEAQKGEVWNPDEGRYDVVPGTKLYRESSAKHATDYKAKTAVQDRVTESLAKIDYVLADENKDGFGYNFGGYTEAYVGQYVPGQAQDVKNTVESLKADITQAGLELMRAGGSIGAITEREWPLLEKQIAAVTPYVSEKRARDLLENVAQRLKNIQTRATETYDTQWGETQFYTPSEALPPGGGAPSPASGGTREGATATNPQTGERVIYRNGIWQRL
jgi:hypothetical protein